MFCFQLRVRPWYFSSALMGLFAIRTICRSKCFILFFFVLRFLSFDVCGVPVCVRGSCRTSTNSWRCIVYSNSIIMYCLQGDVLRPQTTYISKIKHRHRHSMRWTPMAKKNGLIRKKHNVETVGVRGATRDSIEIKINHARCTLVVVRWFR